MRGCASSFTALLVLAALAAPGVRCSSGPGAGEDGRETSSDAPVTLPDGHRADASTDSARTPQAECEADADCATKNMVCDCTGTCVTPGAKACEEDKNCGGGSYCDPCVRWCFPKKTLCQPCRSEHFCNPVTGECVPTGPQCDVEGSRCLDYVTGGSYCGQACLSDPGCPEGFSCMDLSGLGLDVKQCVPMSESCAKIKECEKDVECEFSQICNPDGVCVQGCTEDTACAQGKVCSGFRCVDKCDQAAKPCPEGQECDAVGHCKIPGGCIDAYDCPEPETYCNQDAHKCQPGCQHDIDCKSAAMICELGKCVTKGCDATYWCAFGQVCDLDTAECIIPPEPFCKPGCETDEECGPEPSKCLELQDEEGASLGKFCFPKCYDDPQNPCPQGYQCMDLQDENGQSMGQVCVRACHKAPVTFE